MHDTYDPSPSTAVCPYCEVLAYVPDFFTAHPSLEQAILELLCPLGHRWGERRTRASCRRYWDPEATSAPAPSAAPPHGRVASPAPAPTTPVGAGPA